MSNHSRWAIAFLLLPLAACNPNPSTPMAQTVPMPQTMPGVSAQDQNFAVNAAASDLFEIQSSQLALQKSHNPAVQRFARRMIDDHTRSTQQLTTLASAKGIPLTPALDPTQQQAMAVLQGAARTFDREYWRAQVRGHQAAAALYQTEINGGYDGDLKGFAQQTLPIIQQHLDMAQRQGGIR
jgi:putative membrane protein